MQAGNLQVNPHGNLQLIRLGREQTPAIIIDDFLVETDPVIEHACGDHAYQPDNTSAYPGLRAPLPKSYVITILNGIYRLLFGVYSVPSDLNMRPINSVYSLVTIPEENLMVPQRVPHYDSTRPFYLAILHYLAPGEFADTGLFRHRPTGFENIRDNRLDTYVASREAHAQRHGVPPAQYIRGSTDQYEMFDKIDYRPNRLVVYPGTLLHSILVEPERDVSTDPATGRLTANIFVDFQPQSGRYPG
jgi:hypothetical protein